ncbi:MAG TPA: hypothetical protein VM866_01515 [Pyrinomonadaceae bacterium]|nr:hypothetical protein [Pyrinomonadaceae bacterium]
MKDHLNFSLMRILWGLMLAPALFVHAQTSNTSQTSTETRPRTVTTQTRAMQSPTVAPATTPAPATIKISPTPTPTPTQTATPTPMPPISAPTATPMMVSPAPLPPVTLQPAHPLQVSKARLRIAEAQRQLKARMVPTALSPNTSFVTLAALEPDTSHVHLVTLLKEAFLTKDYEAMLTSSRGTSLRVRIVRPNYVNTAVVVSDSAGKQLSPLVVEYPIEKFGKFREMAYYTSTHPALLSPEVVKTGQQYVRTMVDLAAKRLQDKGHIIQPSILDIAERLCLVEHVDHDRFRKENRSAIYDDVFALYALNEIDTYRYSVSTAGAGGMVQMIPWTYNMIRQRYPGVGLNPDFVAGMRNHGNALEAMLLYMRDTWNDLALNPDVSYALGAKLATQAELMAAGYNSNPARLGLYIRRGDDNWRAHIPRETQMYLQIYKSVEGLVPMKARETKAQSGISTSSN